MEYKTCRGIVVKSDDKRGIIDAIFAIHGVLDLQGDVGHPGMFKRSFRTRGHKVRILDNHQATSILNVIGKPLALRELTRNELPPVILSEHPEASGGALAKIQMLMDTPEGKGSYIRLAQSAISEWSYAYDAIKYDYSQVSKNGKQVTARNLLDVEIYEVSPVLWGAQSLTMTTAVKSRRRTDLELLLEIVQERREIEKLIYGGRTATQILAEIYLEQEEFSKLL